MAALPKVTGATGGQFFASETHKMLETANQEAGKMQDEFVSIEHLLIALVKSNEQNRKLLKELGMTEKNLRKVIDENSGRTTCYRAKSRRKIQCLKEICPQFE